MSRNPLRNVGLWDGVPCKVDELQGEDEPASPAQLHEAPDRRRPLRDMAAVTVAGLTDAEKQSLVVYWASVAPAAFLLAVEAFEHDTRW